VTKARSTFVCSLAILGAGSLGAPGADAHRNAAQVTAATRCGISVERRAPAAWARFGAPGGGTPHIAAGDRVYGFFFTKQLLAGNPSNPHNKILWIVHDGSPTRTITVTATRRGTTATAHLVFRAVDRAGRIYPSYVNLPAAGCWALELRWNGRSTSTAVQVVTS
jgi:hypothetical protein